MELRLPAIRGIGGSIIYLIDRYEGNNGGDDLSIYDIDFVYDQGVDRHPVGAGLKIIDQLTHNVYGGRIAPCAAVYERLTGFRRIRYFDIKAQSTGRTSYTVHVADHQILTPLNRSVAAGHR